MEKNNTNRFIIDLTDMDISDKNRARISSVMCSTAMKAIFDTNKGEVEGIFRAHGRRGGRWVYEGQNATELFEKFDKFVENDIVKNRFIIDLGDMKLSEEQHQFISTTISEEVAAILLEIDELRKIKWVVFRPPIFAGGIFGPIDRNPEDIIENFDKISNGF